MPRPEKIKFDHAHGFHRASGELILKVRTRHQIAADWEMREGEIARNLLLGLASDSSRNQVSPSIYETGRIISLAPWLEGHQERLAFLTSRQLPDGAWGAADGYSFVPTLSATEALLRESLREGVPQVSVTLDAARRGLRALFGLQVSFAQVPDTIAAEFLAPWMVAEINALLESLSAHSISGLDEFSGAKLPKVDDTALAGLRYNVKNGRGIPSQLWHSLEVLGEDARGAEFVRPANGAVGCSPAATAAWLGTPGPERLRHPSVQYLTRSQAMWNGAVPGVTPISVFEPAWVLSALAGAGIKKTVPPIVVSELHQAIGELGAPAGTGLPPDSDDTAGALYALAKIGSPHPVDCLWSYEADSYFYCFPGERTPSTSTNAHILDALGEDETVDALRRHLAIEKISRWLTDQQNPEGSWWDKWHASPYYATACCALALARHGGPQSHAAVARAVDWIIATQRDDGSWGRWEGTAEETAYAMQTLLSSGVRLPSDEQIPRAAARGAQFLLRLGDEAEHPPLWHDKELYTPIAVVRAARLAALHLAMTRPDVQDLLSMPLQ